MEQMSLRCKSDCLLSYYHGVAREWVRNLDLRVQVHPGEFWVSKQRVHIVLEASKSAGAPALTHYLVAKRI